MFNSKSILVVAAILSTAAAAHAAPAAEPGVPQMRVPYGDLDVRSRAGAEVFYHRMEAASRVACAYVGEGNSLADRNLNKFCREDLMSQGVDRMHSRALEEVAANPHAALHVATR